MRAYYPIFRWLLASVLIALATIQQIWWLTQGCINTHNWLVVLVWYGVCIGASIMASNDFFPKQDPGKHKFRVKFYGIHSAQIRICTRTYSTIWKFCFKQMAHTKSFFFTIRQLDKHYIW